MRHMNTALIGLELRRRQMKALRFLGIWIGTLVLVMGPAIALAQGIPVQQKICWDGTEPFEGNPSGAATPDGDIFKCNFGEPHVGPGHSTIEIPDGQTLMVEYISMRCFASDPQTVPLGFNIFTGADRADGEDDPLKKMFALHRFTVNSRGNNRRGDPFYYGAQATRIYAKGGISFGPELRVFGVVTGPGYITCAGALSGQLMPSP